MLEITLFEHNQSAYDAALDMMRQTGKAAVIHPTGTGKSFIAFRLCADHPDKRILWLSPSEYIFKTQLENLKAVAGDEELNNITFCTYAKLMLMEDTEIAGICQGSAVGRSSDEKDTKNTSCLSSVPDYIILDEFHRCGAKCWGQGVQRLLAAFPEVPILGLSATNIRYLDNQRDMADELFDGNVASQMNLGEAIVRGILNPPKYVLSVYSWKKDLVKYEKRISQCRSKLVRDECDRYLEELRRTLEMADGLDVIFDKHMSNRTGKYIVFCSSKEHMDEMLEHLNWFAKVDPHPHVYSLYSSDPGADREFDNFRNDNDNTHLRLLYCIDALNEGIHVEGISGVILLRPTVSPVVYKQQIGRALSANRSGASDIFDVVSNIEALSSIDSLEEEMQLMTSYYRSLGEDELIVNEHFRIIDEVQDCRRLFAKLNDMLTASWDLMFEQAKAFYEENGNLEVPCRYITADGYALGNWIVNQRRIRKGQLTGTLTEERIRRLDSIGMVWEAAGDLKWERYYAAAKRYREKYGDLNAPVKYVDEEGVALGVWLSNIRALKNAGGRQIFLSPERVQKLDELGMIWDVLDYFWERNYAAAANYYREHRNLNVPAGYKTEDGIRLGTWVCRLRVLHAGTAKGTPPTEEQVRRLDAIGMVWTDLNEDKWEKGFQAAAAYQKEHGNLQAPNNYVADNGCKLRVWLQRQRSLFKKGKLSEERTQRLNSISSNWQEDAWESKLVLVKAWYQEKGTLYIPRDTVVDGVWLGAWLKRQKEYLEAGKLTPEQAALLSELPLEQVLAPQEDKAWKTWLQMYQDAKAYVKEHGSLKNIPHSYRGESGGVLYAWVSRQRLLKRSGRLSEKQIQMLDGIGFVWEPLAETDLYRDQINGRDRNPVSCQSRNCKRNSDRNRSRNRSRIRAKTNNTESNSAILISSFQDAETG